MTADTQAGDAVAAVTGEQRTEEQIEARAPVTFLTGVGDVRESVPIAPLERWASKLWKNRASAVLTTFFGHLSGDATVAAEDAPVGAGDADAMVQEKIGPTGSPMLGLNWERIQEGVQWVLMESGEELADLVAAWGILQCAKYEERDKVAAGIVGVERGEMAASLDRATDEQVAAMFVQCVRFAFPFGQLAETVSTAMNGMTKKKG